MTGQQSVRQTHKRLAGLESSNDLASHLHCIDPCSCCVESSNRILELYHELPLCTSRQSMPNFTFPKARVLRRFCSRNTDEDPPHHNRGIRVTVLRATFDDLGSSLIPLQ
ncbi:hypothetical protein BAUCODRAFT_386259 [Baudoinia panamericana UAMH 10762]|uniref:Uncharacterized protein n=1 Tax=Baudoinia panamericana (strain UAMH 10762) TaxID=717646 RepID=M2NIN8_BAUPA|nr:uncharacterized protein BAUCODRAFT_386259 [Baudoinia panamericana UAMH 10762]EMC98960.1 hypothetical protein BAUCODRAFT_386259 [Baudoinia panamericana UAMH 10762]